MLTVIHSCSVSKLTSGCNMQVCVNLPWAPAHTFGIRHSPFIGEAVHYPAPEGLAAV